MGDAVTRGQALQIAARVATQVKWDDINGDRLQNEVISLSSQEFGQRLTDFFNNGCNLILPGPMLIKRDRVVKTFNPAEFVGVGHTIWCGPANGNGLEGELDQDERSLALDELDLNKVRFETTLEKGEKVVKGEERLVRLKSKSLIRLDPGWLEELLKDTTKFPEQWKKLGVICFDGQILRDPRGNRFVLYLCWGGRAWRWCARWLGSGFDASYPSAVLAS